jgi:hypothetical protein
MRGLICLVGESFRLGRQAKKAKDVDDAYEPQKSASMSAVAFVDQISAEHGINFDVFISSYKTKWQSELESWYGNLIVGNAYLDRKVGLEALVANARKQVNFTSYDFLFVLRIDLLVKPMLRRIFDPKWDKIMYPQACWVGGHLCKGRPRVSDTMVYVPGRLANSRFFMNHGAAASHALFNGLQDDVGLMIDTFHDSDSSKDYNPLYRIVGRPESRRWRDYGLVSQEIEAVESDLSCVFDDWSILDLIHSENKEQLGVLSSEDLISSSDLWECWSSFKGRRMMLSRLVRLCPDSRIVGSPWGDDDCSRWIERGKKLMLSDKQGVIFDLARERDGVYSGFSQRDKRWNIKIKRLIIKKV